MATCNPGGAGEWKAAHGAALRGRRVVVLPDNDEAGEDHAAKAAAALQRVAPDVAVLRLPDLPPKGDVPDWIDASGTAANLERLVAQALEAPAAEAKPGGARRRRPVPAPPARARPSSSSPKTCPAWWIGPSRR